MPEIRTVVFGAGGFAREVRWLMEEVTCDAHRYSFVGYVVTDTAKLGEHDSTSDILGDQNWLETNRGKWDALAVGIGNPAVRLQLGRDLRLRFPDALFPALVHPTVRYDPGSCEFAEGALLCAGVIATVNVNIEPFVLVNLSCTLGHEVVVGAGSVLNPTVNVSGGVRIGRGALIGTGAQILQYVSIGDGGIVGAGAVVTKDVGSGETVVGIPARLVRRES